MANLIYLTLNGEMQGLISAGCSSLDSIGNKAQLTHCDQIMVMGLSHGLTRQQNVNHQMLTIIKPVDKSSPLLGKAISENECLSCDFSFYRTSRTGMNECYYQLKLINARISSIHLHVRIPLMIAKDNQRNRLNLLMNQLAGNIALPEQAHTVCGMSGFYESDH